jgi:hypothetical protein
MPFAGGVAVAAAALTYTGQTSQGLQVKLTVGSRGVGLFTIQSRKRCYSPTGHPMGSITGSFRFKGPRTLRLDGGGRFFGRGRYTKCPLASG